MNKIAVYGSLLKGFGNASLMGDSPLLAVDEVEGYEMYSLGYFPGIIPGDGKIKVEVYEVNETTLRNLDRLEGHPFMYERVPVKTVNGLEVEIYEYKRTSLDGRPRVESGDWREYCTGE